MSKFLKDLLNILSAVADWFERKAKKREQAEHQSQHNDIEENPGEWFKDHFNRPDGDPDGLQQPASVPDDDESASEADPAKRNSDD